ncbi:MAG: hypothetical protein V7K41_21770 [Nostoc sp.]|uniref:hypothetical protein n=1 Tax=Nostoc sp. TaxID=1180 RepID=UPI002FF97156
MTFINLDVGWVEERNPTPKDLRKVGFHFVQPNLHLFFFPQSDRRGLNMGHWVLGMGDSLSFVSEPLSFVDEALSFVNEVLSFVSEPLSFVNEALSFG